MSPPTDAISQPPFLTGANLPWVHYGIDFGANAWRPDGGVSQAEERALLDITFARLAASGMSWIRWFLFCDGRAGIRFTGGGRPAGLDDHVFDDVDAAVELAQRHGIRIMFVLLDFLWCDTASIVHGVQLGGRSRVLADREYRRALLDTVLAPLLERYGAEPAIFAWDVINEPEWIKTIDWIDVRPFIDEAVRLAHSLTSHPVTVGSAGVRWRENYIGLGLDFYQVHWYDSLTEQPGLETPVRMLGFDRPVLLGEFPTRGSSRTVAEILGVARAAGYTGALSWSVLSKDDSTAV